MITLHCAVLFLAAVIGGLLSDAEPASSQATTPTVFLNHFFVVIDSKSYEAMQADPFLTTGFAPWEKRTTIRNDETYTGVYWYGRNTYFEVFEPPAQGPVGASGLALGVDGEGESAAVKERWSASLGGAQTFPVTRRTETAEPVWFHMTAGGSAQGLLRVWLMEYDREFLARWHENLTPARGKRRAEVLDRYVAKIGKSADRETAVLGDVTRLVMALDESDLGLLAKHLTPVGWVVTERSPKERTTFRGPGGVLIEVVPQAGDQRGIIEAEFSVQGQPKPRSTLLGSVRLTIEPSRARLRFVP